MISSKVLEDLLQEPLGPYHDCDILDETACQTKGATKLVLYAFILEHNGHVIGLDESERPVDGEDGRKFRFRGILKIADPGWLSDFGLKTIEAELNLRERTLRLGEGRRSGPLTLEYLFQEHLARSKDATWRKEETCLTVLIQGEKSMPAVYMQSSSVPDGLSWFSKAHKRNYKINTMDVETYSHSENFFRSWRLFALMEKISKLYPYVPRKKRTPRWFVEKYIARFACLPEDKHRRVIFDEDDSDVDETGKTVTPRHLLKPHTSEILGLFAAQAGWFVTNDAVRRSGLLDMTSWEKFAQEVRRERREAFRQGVIWGWPAGQEPEEREEDSGDELNRMVRENPVIGKSNETLANKIQRARARSNRETKATISSGSDSEGDAQGGAHYVSDFSETSDAEEDDTDHRLAEEEAMDHIPWQLQVPPLLPDVDGRWWCPLQDCNYQINLYDLTEEEESGVSGELVGYILQKQWRNAAYDKKVLQGFGQMVTNHYAKHFEEHGVTAERREGRESDHSRPLENTRRLTSHLQMRFVSIDGRRRHQDQGGNERPIRGPMPVLGTLKGESRVVPTVHAPQVGNFQ